MDAPAVRAQGCNIRLCQAMRCMVLLVRADSKAVVQSSGRARQQSAESDDREEQLHMHLKMCLEKECRQYQQTLSQMDGHQCCSFHSLGAAFNQFPTADLL